MERSQKRSLVFLPPTARAAGGKAHQSLDTAARAHASRQGHRSKTSQPHGTGIILYEFKNDPSDSRKGKRAVARALQAQQAQSSKSTAVCRGLPLLKDVGSTVWDPFDALPIPPISSEELFYLGCLKTSLVPFGETDLARASLIQCWFLKSISSPAVMYAELVSGALYYKLRNPEADCSQQLSVFSFRSRARAINELKKVIQSFATLDTVTANDVILSVFLLGVHDGVYISPQPEPHPMSPLAMHREAFLYGRMTPSEEHLNAMYTMIEQRGGLESLDAQIFPSVVPYTDMIHHLRTGTPPRLPNRRQFQQLAFTEQWQPDDLASQRLASWGSAFGINTKEESLMKLIQLDTSVVMALLTLAEISVAADHVHRKTSGAPSDLHPLANNMDWAVHKIISQETYLDNNSSTGANGPDFRLTMCEILRLATILYIDMVILPSPAQTGIKSRNSTRLLPLLQSWQTMPAESKRPEFDDLILWATMLGAIGSRFTLLEPSYTEYLRTHFAEEVEEWRHIEPRMYRFLWLECVCNEPAQDLTERARRDPEEIPLKVEDIEGGLTGVASFTIPHRPSSKENTRPNET